MPRCNHRLPGFKASCLIMCGLYVAVSGMILLRGVRPSMAPFGVPEVALDSPHYHDAILWVYTHMLVLGLVLGLAGLRAEGERFRRSFARLMFGVHAVYTYLDLRSSDSALGDGLYQGPGSLGPVVVGLLGAVLFAHLGLCAAARGRT